MKKIRLTAKQRRALDNLERGIPFDHGICGHGGQKLLLEALRRKGLVK